MPSPETDERTYINMLRELQAWISQMEERVRFLEVKMLKRDIDEEIARRKAKEPEPGAH